MLKLKSPNLFNCVTSKFFCRILVNLIDINKLSRIENVFLHIQKYWNATEEVKHWVGDCVWALFYHKDTNVKMLCVLLLIHQIANPYKTFSVNFTEVLCHNLDHIESSPPKYLISLLQTMGLRYINDCVWAGGVNN